MEQNLRDLQCQYYETVKQLDAHKSSSESVIAELRQSLAELQNRLEISQNNLADSEEKHCELEKQLNDIKESSQLLEKKYHRAKKIIKDMQSREESFTRREQLYQQKLDEIEHELGLLIETFDSTIMEEGLRYFSLDDSSVCTKTHQTRLDVFGLLKRILDNFQTNDSTQSAQIKQRILSMLEQHLANLIARSNGTSVTGTIGPSTSLAVDSQLDANRVQQLVGQTKQPQQKQHPYAAHRLSHPNLPYPIGVGGQPTKIFHGLAQITGTTQPNSMVPNANNNNNNDTSLPQSVNSYPSSNSLNSLNNNNQPTTVNNNIISAKQQLVDIKTSVAPLGALQATPNLLAAKQLSSASEEINKQPDVPFQTSEWHEKPVYEWTTSQVSTWLLALGLDQYISKFEDRNVNGQSLINLDSTVLKGLGVLNSQDRNLLKKKIRELRVEMEKERKQIEKKIKANLKDKSKTMQSNSSQSTLNNTNKPSWNKGVLS